VLITLAEVANDYAVTGAKIVSKPLLAMAWDDCVISGVEARRMALKGSKGVDD
jgi:hypothetical protein